MATYRRSRLGLKNTTRHPDDVDVIHHGSRSSLKGQNPPVVTGADQAAAGDAHIQSGGPTAGTANVRARRLGSQPSMTPISGGSAMLT